MIGNILTLGADTLAVLVAFFGGSAFHARRVAQRTPKPKEKNYRCGCQHVLAYHNPKTGECHAESVVGHRVARTNKSGAVMSETLYVEDIMPCTCQVYSGDLPDDWYSRIISGEAA